MCLSRSFSLLSMGAAVMKGNNSERATLTVKEAAAMLGISKNTAYMLARRGELPGVIRLGDKRLVVSKVQLEALLQGNER
jgi:excisionase family DNA binding protein